MFSTWQKYLALVLVVGIVVASGWVHEKESHLSGNGYIQDEHFGARHVTMEADREPRTAYIAIGAAAESERPSGKRENSAVEAIGVENGATRVLDPNSHGQAMRRENAVPDVNEGIEILGQETTQSSGTEALAELEDLHVLSKQTQRSFSSLHKQTGPPGKPNIELKGPPGKPGPPGEPGRPGKSEPPKGLVTRHLLILGFFINLLASAAVVLMLRAAWLSKLKREAESAAIANKLSAAAQVVSDANEGLEQPQGDTAQ